MKRYSLVLIIIVTVNLVILGQDVTVTPSQITPSSGNILQAELSPDGSHLAVMTMNEQGDTAIEVWDTSETDNPVKLTPDLTLFDGFNWSPNSQYVAATGNRGNATGTEYSLGIYDIWDEGNFLPSLYPRPGRDFREFATSSEETEWRSDFVAVWSNDSKIVALNFRDGIHFYDITACKDGECNQVHFLDVGYLSWFDWQGDTLVNLSDNTVQLWNVSGIFH